MGTIGNAIKTEAANARIDAALATLVPDAVPPGHFYNRAAGEVARVEWIADTLEALVAGPAPEAAGSPERDEDTAPGGITPEGDESSPTGNETPRKTTRGRKAKSEG